ncbi:MAG TPA: ricin-type beta-trefoil lectin domain protein [Acidimicrobiales bacterium]
MGAVALAVGLLPHPATVGADVGTDATAAARQYVQIRNRDSVCCIEVANSAVETGSRIQMSTCRGQSGSMWELRRPPGHTGSLPWIYNPGSNRCVSLRGVESGTPSAGTALQLEPCEWRGADDGAGDDSVWRFVSGGPNRENILSGLRLSDGSFPCVEYDGDHQLRLARCGSNPRQDWVRVRIRL